MSENPSARTSSEESMSPEDRRQGDLLADQEQHDRGHGADEPAQKPFHHERAAHEPVRRPDELHHLDLAPAREDRQPDRVRDQQHGRDQQHEHGDEEHDLDHAGDLEDPLGRLLPVLHALDPGEPLRANGGGDLFTSSARLGVMS